MTDNCVDYDSSCLPLRTVDYSSLTYNELKAINPGIKTTGQKKNWNNLLVSSSQFIAFSSISKKSNFSVINIDDLEGVSSKSVVTVVNRGNSTLCCMKSSPFHQSILAAAYHDGRIKIWDIPKYIQKKKDEMYDCVCELSNVVESSQNKTRPKLGYPFSPATSNVVYLEFNPVADFILASLKNLKCLNLWNIETCSCCNSFDIDNGNSVKWNQTGSSLSTIDNHSFCKIYDPRAPRLMLTWDLNEQKKNVKFNDVIWIDGFSGNSNMLMTTGKSSNTTFLQSFQLWDIRNIQKGCVSYKDLEVASCYLEPEYDESTGLIFFCSQGNKTIVSASVHTDDKEFIRKISSFKLSQAAKAFCYLPKHATDFKNSEVYRMYVSNDLNLIQPVSFYLPSTGDKASQCHPISYFRIPYPALGGAQWLSGKNAEPKRFNISKSLSAMHPHIMPLTFPYLESRYLINFSRGLLLEKIENMKITFEKMQDQLSGHNFVASHSSEKSCNTKMMDIYMKLIRQLEEANVDKDYLIHDLQQEIESLKSKKKVFSGNSIDQQLKLANIEDLTELHFGDGH